ALGRGGPTRGQGGWTAEILDDSAAPDLIERALTTLYSEGTAPREVLVPVLPRNRAQIQELMGARVDLRVPQRGEKKDLLRTVGDNATEALRLHRLKRTGDLTPAPRPSRTWARRSSWRSRRCASSASTSPTPTAPTWSAPRWCSRTACRARASTAATPSAARRRVTTPPRCTT